MLSAQTAGKLISYMVSELSFLSFRSLFVPSSFGLALFVSAVHASSLHSVASSFSRVFCL